MTTKKIIIMLITATIFGSCATTENSNRLTIYKDKIEINTETKVQYEFFKGKGFNHPTFVIWKEDMEGNYLETVFITESYASGIFGYEMIGDTSWVNRRGPSFQPAALPYWTYKKGELKNGELIPTPENPYVDAYSGATPEGDFQFHSAIESSSKYRILIEVNQAWDWNKSWTNNLHPDSEAYKHSAQPSVIYAVTIDQEHNTYHFNPIGHGDPRGESGKLFTNISTLDTALEIFPIITLTTTK
jgi:hypothetical protein